jgi:hypothetical protein
MRGIAIRAGIAVAIAIAGFAILVAVLNATVLSAAGYVQGYLNALERRDSATALQLAGELPATSRRTDLLIDDTIVPVTVLEVTTDDEIDGITPVDVTFEVDGRTGSATFLLQRSNALFGLFPVWRFAESPLASAEITVMNTTDFTVNGVHLRAPVQNEAVRYLTFAPGILTLEHESSLLVSVPEVVLVDDPAAPLRAVLTTEASPSFVAQVQTEVDRYLDECASQQKLFPDGCPFGQGITDRIISEPEWQIVSPPIISLQPTSTPGEWTAPTTPGVARLIVDVKSIYDGDIETFDEPVPFSIGFTVTFVGASEVVLTPRLGEG